MRQRLLLNNRPMKREQYTQLLNQQIQEEQSSELMQKIQDQEIILKNAWVNNIAAEVKSVLELPRS